MSALIATVVAVTQQRPASTITVAVAIVLLGGWLVVWIVRAKTTRDRPRFPRGRWVAVVVSVLILTGAGFVLIIPGFRAGVSNEISASLQSAQA